MVWHPPWQKPLRGTLLDRSHPLSRGLILAFPINDSGEQASVASFGPHDHAQNTPLDNIDVSGSYPRWQLGQSGIGIQSVLAPTVGLVYAVPKGINANAGTIFGVGNRQNTYTYTTFNPIGGFRTAYGTNFLTVGIYDSSSNYNLAYMVGSTTDPVSTDVPIGGQGNYDFSIGFVADNGDWKIYGNGIQMDSGTYSGSIGTTHKFGLNCVRSSDDDAIYSWGGIVYCVYYWNRALSDAEIAWLHREPYAMFARSRIATTEVPAVSKRKWWPGWQKPLRGMQLNKSHPLCRGLVLAVPLNELTGNRVRDHVDGNIGTFAANAPTWVPGGLNFTDATTSAYYVTFGDLKKLDFTSDFTVASRVVPRVSGQDYKGICNKWSPAAGKGFCLLFRYESYDRFYFQCKDHSGTVRSDANWTLGRKYSVVGMVKGSTSYIYQDGVKQAATASGTIDEGDALSFQIGTYMDAYGSGGEVYYVYIWNRALSDAEIALLHREPYCMFENVRRLGVSEAEAAAEAIQAIATDGISFGEATARVASLLATAVDGLDLGEAPSSLGQFLATGSDGASLSDSSLVGLLLQVSIQDGVSLGDVGAGLGILRPTSADGVSMGDAGSGVGTLRPTALDGLTGGDISSTIATLQGTAVEGLTLGEALSVTALLLATSADGFVLSEVTSAELAGAISALAEDGISFGESTATVLQALATAMDGTTLSEFVSGLSSLVASASDGVSFSEAISRTLTLLGQASDSAVLGDTGTIRCDFIVSASDGFRFAETVAAIMQFAASVTDGFTMSDVSVEVSTLPTGECSITFTSKAATISFTVGAPGISFTSKKPKITFSD